MTGSPTHLEGHLERGWSSDKVPPFFRAWCAANTIKPPQVEVWPRPLLYCLPQASGEGGQGGQGAKGTSAQQRTGMWELTSGDNSNFQRRGRHHKPPSRDRALVPRFQTGGSYRADRAPGGKEYVTWFGVSAAHTTWEEDDAKEQTWKIFSSKWDNKGERLLTASLALEWTMLSESPVFHSRGNTDTWWPRSYTKHDNTRGQHNSIKCFEKAEASQVKIWFPSSSFNGHLRKMCDSLRTMLCCYHVTQYSIYWDQTNCSQAGEIHVPFIV